MIIWSEETASKPSDKMSSHHRLQNQKRQMLFNSNSRISQKRKCKQYINGDKFATNIELVGKRKHGSGNVKDQKRKSSPVLCSTPSNGKKISLPRRQKCGSSTQNDTVEFCTISRQDYSHLSDAEDSTKRPSYLTNEESFYIHAKDLMDNNNYFYGIATSIREKLKKEDIEFTDSRKKFLPFRGNHLSRPFIPIGPRFQAEVPEWEATTNIKQYSSDDCVKWLGTQIWPLPSLSRNIAKSIGKDRSNSSLCENLESIDRTVKLENV